MAGGHIITISFNISDVDVRSYQYHRARREAFSRWLASAASQNIKKEVQDIKFKVNAHSNKMSGMDLATLIMHQPGYILKNIICNSESFR